MMTDSLGSSERLHYVGFASDVAAFDVPPLGGPTESEHDIEQVLLFCHVRNVFEHVKQLWVYSLHYMTPPYSFARLLNPDLVTTALSDLKHFWQLILKIEASSEILLTRFQKMLTLRTLTVVREVCNMLESASWSMTDRIANYVQAWGCNGQCTTWHKWRQLAEHQLFRWQGVQANHPRQAFSVFGPCTNRMPL